MPFISKLAGRALVCLSAAHPSVDLRTLGVLRAAHVVGAQALPCRPSGRRSPSPHPSGSLHRRRRPKVQRSRRSHPREAAAEDATTAAGCSFTVSDKDTITTEVRPQRPRRARSPHQVSLAPPRRARRSPPDRAIVAVYRCGDAQASPPPSWAGLSSQARAPRSWPSARDYKGPPDGPRTR